MIRPDIEPYSQAILMPAVNCCEQEFAYSSGAGGIFV